jgi:hypothetical protein
MHTTRNTRWAGRAATALVIAFLSFDAAGKLLEVPEVVNGTAELGYSTEVVFGLGLTLFACTLAYAIPSTSVLGAILLTGYLGGAVATHVRVGDPTFTHVLFPVYVSLLSWGGLWLRSPQLRSLVTGWSGRNR